MPQQTRRVVVAADIDSVAEGDPQCVGTGQPGLKGGLAEFGIVRQGDVVYEAHPDQVWVPDPDRPRQGKAIIG